MDRIHEADLKIQDLKEEELHNLDMSHNKLQDEELVEKT